MSEEKGVPFFANEYLQTPEGQDELNKIIKARESVDYLCFQLLSEMKSGGWFGALIEAATKTGAIEYTEEIHELLERVDTVLAERDRLTNKILKLVSGQ